MGAASRLSEESKVVADPDVGHLKCPSAKSLSSLVTQRPTGGSRSENLLFMASSCLAQTVGSSYSSWEPVPPYKSSTRS